MVEMVDIVFKGSTTHRNFIRFLKFSQFRELSLYNSTRLLLMKIFYFKSIKY